MFKALKSILILMPLTIFGGVELGAAETSQDLQEMRQTLRILQAELAEVKNRSFAIGSVQQSFLSEEEFQKQMGKNWVLCDGRQVPGSRWERLGYGATIPNCTGRFLRSSGGDAAGLGVRQNQATALNGLTFKATTTLNSRMNVQVSGRTADPSWTGDLAYVSGDGLKPSENAYLGLDSWQNKYVGHDIPYWGRMFGHTHSFSGSGYADGGSWTTLITSTGDQETRPVNITVNTFVKIN
jgi:hypothetical protein